MRRRDPDALFAARRKEPIPFEFVLEELADLEPWTRPMFGCTAVYVEEKILFVLRRRQDGDDGVWLATTREHHDSLLRELPNMRSITVFGAGRVTGWQVLPLDAEDFEESVLRACALVRARDSRIGKVPNGKKKAQKARRRKRT